MRRTTIVAAVLMLTLAACGGDDDKSAASSSSAPAAPTSAAASSSAVSTAATSAPASSPAATSASSATSSAAAPAGGPDGKATCDFLRAGLPEWQKLGKDGALVQLAIGYFAFVEKLPGDQLPDASTLDAVTTRDCPEVRAELLTLLQAKAFAGTL